MTRFYSTGAAGSNAVEREPSVAEYDRVKLSKSAIRAAERARRDAIVLAVLRYAAVPLKPMQIACKIGAAWCRYTPASENYTGDRVIPSLGRLLAAGLIERGGHGDYIIAKE